MRLSDADVCAISRGSLTCLTLRLVLLIFAQRNSVLEKKGLGRTNERGTEMCRQWMNLTPFKPTSTKFKLPSSHFKAEYNFKRLESLGCGLDWCKYRPTPTPALCCFGMASPHQSWVNPEQREFSMEVSQISLLLPVYPSSLMPRNEKLFIERIQKGSACTKWVQNQFWDRGERSIASIKYDGRTESEWRGLGPCPSGPCDRFNDS